MEPNDYGRMFRRQGIKIELSDTSQKGKDLARWLQSALADFEIFVEKHSGRNDRTESKVVGEDQPIYMTIEFYDRDKGHFWAVIKEDATPLDRLLEFSVIESIDDE